MKKYNFCTIVLLLIFNWQNSSLFSQIQKPYRPFEKINFQELNSVWYETMFDSLVIDDYLDGYSHFRPAENINPLVYEDKIYSAFYINTHNGKVGSYIVCRDIKSGKIIWKDRYGMLDGQHIEIPTLMFIENDKLVVYGQVKRDAEFGNNVLPSFRNMILSKRLYNIVDGNLTLYSHGDFDDFQLLDTHNDVFYIYKNFFFKEQGKVRYIQPIPTGDLLKTKVHSFLLDEQGRALSHDSLLTHQFFYNISQIAEDTLLIVEVDSASLLFRYVSPELKTYYVKRTNYPFDLYPAYMDLKEVSVVDRKLLFYNQRNEFYPHNYFEVYVFNFDGSLSHKYDLKDMYIENFVPIRWQDRDGLLLTPNYQIVNGRRSKSMLQVKSFSNETEEEILKTFVATDSLRTLYPDRLISIGNGELLFSFSESAYYVDTFYYLVNLDYHATASSFMKIKEKDLGIISNTDNFNVNTHSNGIRIVPNPVKDDLFINLPTNFEGKIGILDISGRLVSNVDITRPLSQIIIDMSGLLSGVYFVKIEDDDTAFTVKVVKGD